VVVIFLLRSTDIFITALGGSQHLKEKVLPRLYRVKNWAGALRRMVEAQVMTTMREEVVELILVQEGLGVGMQIQVISPAGGLIQVLEVEALFRCGEFLWVAVGEVDIPIIMQVVLEVTAAESYTLRQLDLMVTIEL
jgi:hypothetical protein